MSFNPFGKGFQINSPLSIVEVREAIYQRQRNQFDTGYGPGALVVGSLILLWLPSVGYGAQPQLICRVTGTNQSSRISGRMGFGILHVWTIAAVFGGAAFVALLMGRISGISALTAACLPLLLFAFNDTKCAEPLLRYLQNCLDRKSGLLGASVSSAPLSREVALEVGSTARSPPLTTESILDALLHLQETDAATLFLHRRGGGSLQATTHGGDFALERRIEGEAGYQRAYVRRILGEDSDRLSRDEAFAALHAYAAGAPLPDTIEWRRVAPRHG